MSAPTPMKSPTHFTSPRLTALSASLFFSAIALNPLSAQTSSVASGDWLSSEIWSAGVPTNTQVWTVSAGHAVTAGAGVNYSSTTTDNFVIGTLNVNSGASIFFDRFNNTSTTTTGIVNISGGDLSFNRLAVSTPSGTLTFNVSAGTLSSRELLGSGSINQFYTVNLSGGTIRLAGDNFNPVATLTGGKVVMVNGTGNNMMGTAGSSWNGGTIVTNSTVSTTTTNVNAWGSTTANAFMSRWSENDVNVFQLSDKTTKQTVTTTVAATANQGQLHMNIYSAAANDNDVLSTVYINGATVNNNALTLGTGVDLSIFGVSLAGEAADYIGTSYKLFNSSLYAGIQATVSSTIFNIGGNDYEVDWINTLSTNGTLTIGNLTLAAIPEPSTYAALVGVGMLGFAALRRRR